MKHLGWCLLCFLVLACQNKPSGTRAQTGEAAGEVASTPTGMEVEMMRITSGQLNWTASKTGGQHLGTVNVADGSVSVKGNEILSGEMNVDMNSIVSIDLDGEMKAKLEGHLKSDDFFGVASHPKVRFVITEVTQARDVPMATHKITGNLTIKEITKSITVPINISFVGDKLLAATPAFTIDRTEWDLKYNSKILGTAPDKLIHDEVSLVLTFEAQK